MRIKIINIFGFSLVLSACLSLSSADTLPTTTDIISLQKQAKQTADDFLQKSVEPRLDYEYCGRFLLANDRENLHALAKAASLNLQGILSEQQRIKSEIEDYDGSDWEARYGQTGLWRQIASDYANTTYLKCLVDYYMAICTDPPQNKALIEQTLEEVQKLNQAYNIPACKLLEAELFALRAEFIPVSAQSAEISLDKLIAAADTPDDVYLGAAICRLKLSRTPDISGLNELNMTFDAGSLKDDIEPALSVSFANHRAGKPQSLEKTIKKLPQTQGFVGKLILYDLLSEREDSKLDSKLKQFSAFEIATAVHAAVELKVPDCRLLIEKIIAIPELQTPAVLYYAGTALSDISVETSVDLLVKASRLQDSAVDSNLPLKPDEIAQTAASLAYRVFGEKGRPDLALPAMENYYRLAGENIDRQLEYSYAAILNKSGRSADATAILQRIADRPGGEFADRAKFDLILGKFTAGDDEENHQQKLLQIENFIYSLDKKSKILPDALYLYGQMLLKDRQKASSQKLIDVCSRYSAGSEPRFGILKAEALSRLDKPDEAVPVLLAVLDANDCQHSVLSSQILAEVIEKMDFYRFSHPDFDTFARNCFKLSQYNYNCCDADNRLNAAASMVEFAVFAFGSEPNNLVPVENAFLSLKTPQLPDVSYLRAKARLLADRKKFSEAASIWSQIAEMTKAQPAAGNMQGWGWWQAKFYELDCWAQISNAPAGDILHAIEVLENTFTDTPPFWKDRLIQLKNRLQSAGTNQ